MQVSDRSHRSNHSNHSNVQNRGRAGSIEPLRRNFHSGQYGFRAPGDANWELMQRSSEGSRPRGQAGPGPLKPIATRDDVQIKNIGKASGSRHMQDARFVAGGQFHDTYQTVDFSRTAAPYKRPQADFADLRIQATQVSLGQKPGRGGSQW